jgi:hypothetical protein
MTPEEKQKIIDIIKMKVNLPCSRCGQKEFTLLDGYLKHDIYKISNNKIIYDDRDISFPCVSIICDNCGYISQHCLGILGLMPSKLDS